MVSSTAEGSRRTNQSDRGSETGSTRACAVRMLQWSAPASTSERSSEADLGQVVLELRHPGDQVLDRPDVDHLGLPR